MGGRKVIDTDKYEGHTSNWKWIYLKEGYDYTNSSGFYLYSLQSIFGNEIIHDTPDGKLAADAPLLLAEVKRLREEQIRYKNIVGEFDEFMCNNWTPDGVHSLWNELFSKYPATGEEDE